MSNKVYEYKGKAIAVQYDVKRCIHAEECVHGLPGVFDPERRPWIDPDAATVDEVAQVVMRCPTGALHFQRPDGPQEPVPEQNAIRVSADGPLYLQGRLEVKGADGEVALSDTRLALCRCGASKNKPYCDGAHTEIDFKDPGALGDNAVKSVDTQGEQLKITPAGNGPLLIRGEAELKSADGQVCYRGNQMALCRCGASANKPFCDGSHARIGFSDSSEVGDLRS